MSERNKKSFIRDGLYNIERTMQLDPAAHSKWEVFWLYPHIKAIGLHRIAHWFWVHNHTFIARWVSNRARHWTGIEIHPGAVIGRGLMIDHGMGVVIGETAIIGDDCQLYHGVTLGGTGKQHVKRHPTLEDGVYIGCGAKCLGNITLKNFPVSLQVLSDDVCFGVECDAVLYGGMGAEEIIQHLCIFTVAFGV